MTIWYILWSLVTFRFWYDVPKISGNPAVLVEVAVSQNSNTFTERAFESQVDQIELIF
jgi:hypothetical protein